MRFHFALDDHHPPLDPDASYTLRRAFYHFQYVPYLLAAFESSDDLIPTGPSLFPAGSARSVAACHDHLTAVPPRFPVATLVPPCDCVTAAPPSCCLARRRRRRRRPVPHRVSAHPPPLRVTAPVPRSLLRRPPCVPLRRVPRVPLTTVPHPIAQPVPSRIHVFLQTTNILSLNPEPTNKSQMRFYACLQP
ncbi:hypothetical protein B0H14DRAFT_3503119 [Mycena olivaceomarginata]|nr:hypothetical protein B0H14DRAFT_3503119 [Mycena olivaceomarginata]